MKEVGNYNSNQILLIVIIVILKAFILFYSFKLFNSKINSIISFILEYIYIWGKNKGKKRTARGN